MPAVEVTLEQVKPSHLETDVGHGGVSGQATASFSKLRSFPISLGLHLLLDPAMGVPIGIGRHQHLDTPNRALRLSALPEDSRQPDVVVPINIVSAQWTGRTSTLVGKDPSDGLTVSLSYSLGHKATIMTLEWHWPDRAIPALLLPPLRFLSHLKAPSRIGLEKANGATWITPPLPPSREADEIEVYLSIIETLDRVQRLTNTSFAVPKELSQDDVNTVMRIDRLLRGDTVIGTWQEATLALRPTVDGQRILENQPQESAMILATEETVIVANNAIPLGFVGYHFLSTRIKHLDRKADDDHYRLMIVPGNVNEFESWLINEKSTPINEMIPGVSQRFRRQVASFMDENEVLLRRLAE